MANGFWRIGLDNTTEISGGMIGYAFNKPSITRENIDIENSKVNLPKPIIIDVGVWKDVGGNDINIEMPIISSGNTAFQINFPAGSVLDAYTVQITPADATFTTFAISFTAK